MQSQFDITSYVPQAPPAPHEPAPGMADLLRQILDVQRETLAHMQATAAAHDTSGRWRALLARWRAQHLARSDEADVRFEEAMPPAVQTLGLTFEPTTRT